MRRRWPTAFGPEPTTTRTPGTPQQLEYVRESPKLPFGYLGTVVMVHFADPLFRSYATDELRRRGLGPFAMTTPVEPAAVA